MKKKKLISTFVVLIFVVLPLLLTFVCFYKIYEQTQYEVPKKEPPTYKVFYSDSTKSYRIQVSGQWHKDTPHQGIEAVSPFDLPENPYK